MKESWKYRLAIVIIKMNYDSMYIILHTANPLCHNSKIVIEDFNTNVLVGYLYFKTNNTAIVISKRKSCTMSLKVGVN
jgi:hypothetical protein